MNRNQCAGGHSIRCTIHDTLDCCPCCPDYEPRPAEFDLDATLAQLGAEFVKAVADYERLCEEKAAADERRVGLANAISGLRQIPKA